MSAALNQAARRLSEVLQAENAALAAGDLRGAALLLAEKTVAAEALREALPDATPDPAIAAALHRLSTENGERLSHAIEIQGRVLDLVARAARSCAPAPAQYGRRGTLAAATGAQTMILRA